MGRDLWEASVRHRAINLGSVNPSHLGSEEAVQAERKLNMSCIYSTPCVYALIALNLAVYAIPLVIAAYLVIKRAIKVPRAAIRAWVPLLFFFAVILLLHGVSELVGPDGMGGPHLHSGRALKTLDRRT